MPSGAPASEHPESRRGWLHAVQESILEMGLPSRRANLRWGVRSGYAVLLAFTLLALVGERTEMVPQRGGFYVLLAMKLATNTAAWWSLRADRQVMVWQTANTLVDILVLVGGVHMTGGALSPLFATYVLLIAIVAMLTNQVVTLTVAFWLFVAHSAALVLGWAGVLETFPPPMMEAYHLDGAQVGLAIGFAAFVLGVTAAFTTGLVVQRQRREQKLAERTAQLIEANEQRSLFMANVTHELRTPIHGICGVTDLLDAEIYGPIEDTQREAHLAIRESAKTLLRLVDDLLTLARSEAGSLPIRPEPVDAADVADSVAAAVRWMIGTKELELELEVPSIAMTIDRGRLVQVLVNLLSNAVKFTPDGGTVRLSARAEDDQVVFAISDSGIGIPEEERARVFDAFRQVEGGDERTFGGVGLGLAIVQSVVDALGGTVRFESALGEGTTFRVALPRHAAPAPEDDASGGGDEVSEVRAVSR